MCLSIFHIDFALGNPSCRLLISFPEWELKVSKKFITTAENFIQAWFMLNPEDAIGYFYLPTLLFSLIRIFQLICKIKQRRWCLHVPYIFMTTHLIYLTTSAIVINNYLKHISCMCSDYLRVVYQPSLRQGQVPLLQWHRTCVCVHICVCPPCGGDYG